MCRLQTAVLAIAITLLAGCAQAPSKPVDPIDAKRVLGDFAATRGPKIALGTISASDPGLRAIRCRGAGHIGPPGGGAFAKYIEQTLIGLFAIAPGYAADSAIRLEGRLDRIDFSSVNSGKWEIDMTFQAEGVAPFAINSVHHFPTSLNADIACPQVARALGPAMEDLLARLVTHPSFKKLLGVPSAAPQASGTVADARLQSDVMGMIGVLEAAEGGSKQPAFVSASGAGRSGQTVVEHWIVESNGNKVTYEVMLTPSPRGGVDFRVVRLSSR